MHKPLDVNTGKPLPIAKTQNPSKGTAPPALDEKQMVANDAASKRAESSAEQSKNAESSAKESESA